jgi:NTE family protein
MTERTAFVFGGGGRWGAVEVGMLQALEEVHIRPDLVLGTSVGAFNGSVIADDAGPGGVKRLTDLWNEISGSAIFKGGLVDRMMNVATMKPAIHETSELRLILQHVHGADRRIEDLETPFQCVAASIEKAAEHWFTEGPLIDAILASSAIPALFPPVEIDGEHFYDGGLVNSVPVGRAVELGATRIFVLQVGRVEAPLRPPERLHEAALISFEIARRHRFSQDVRNLPEGIDFHLLPSGNPVNFDDRRQLKWRDTGSTQELIDGAFEATTGYLSDVGLT